MKTCTLQEPHSPFWLLPFLACQHPTLCSLQRHELRVLAHHTRTTVLDGLVGDGELTQVVANHLLKRDITALTEVLDLEVSLNGGTPKSSTLMEIFHYKPSIWGYPHLWKPPFDALGWHIWDGDRLDLHRDVLLAVVHTHYAASVTNNGWH